mgnify:CR=1 FL=1
MYILPQHCFDFSVNKDGFIVAKLNVIGKSKISQSLASEIQLHSYYPRHIIHNFAKDDIIYVPRIIEESEGIKHTHIVLPDFILKYKRHILKDFIWLCFEEASDEIRGIIYAEDFKIDAEELPLLEVDEECSVPENKSDVHPLTDHLTGQNNQSVADEFDLKMKLLAYFNRQKDSYKFSIFVTLQFFFEMFITNQIHYLPQSEGFSFVKNFYFCTVTGFPIMVPHWLIDTYRVYPP